MKIISAAQITQAVADLCQQVNYDLPQDVEQALQKV